MTRITLRSIAAVSILMLMVGVVAVPRIAAQPSPPATDPVSVCLATARARAADALKGGASRDAARQQLEIDAATCFDGSLTPAQARLIGIVNSDRARLARELLQGRMTLSAYHAALKDRDRKAAPLLARPPTPRSARTLEALQSGDADGDLVPDSYDRCPRTPFGTPTDDRGCPRRPSPNDTDQRTEGRLREILAGARTLYNPSCDDAPRPPIPVPLEWGRGAQTRFGTAGFNMAVAEVGGQPTGCEVFYEIQLRFFNPNGGNPALPPSKIVTMVFSASEDLLLTDSVRAVFGLPTSGALSPARGEALEAFLRQYSHATWRVRAVNGSNRTSPWSHFLTQNAASGGVAG